MLPKVIVHNMVSIDGRMDWLNGDLGLYYELSLRLQYDAILSSSNTMIAGTSVLDAEAWAEMEQAEPLTPQFARHLMVIVDSGGRFRDVHRLRRSAYWGDTVVLCSRSTPDDFLAYLHERDVAVIVTGHEKVDLRAALATLRERYDIGIIRVDSGGVLNGVLLREGLVDEVSLLLQPVLVGGRSPRTLFVSDDLTSNSEVVHAQLAHLEDFPGGYVWLRYKVQRENNAAPRT